jgi:predicted nucleic acid-binding protein
LIVVDASVLAPALADDTADGDRLRARLAGETLAAPALADIEVLSVLRSAALAARLDDRRSEQAVADLDSLPLRRAPHLPLLARMWGLRENLTVYAAAYVALAEALEAPLLTADELLAAAPDLRCEIELVT